MSRFPFLKVLKQAAIDFGVEVGEMRMEEPAKSFFTVENINRTALTLGKMIVDVFEICNHASRKGNAER